MTQTPYILWAVLATGLSIVAYLRSEHQRHWKEYWAKESEEAQEQAQEALRQRDLALSDAARWRDLSSRWAQLALSLDGQLYDIKARRKASAKHARQAQLSQQRAKVLEQASKLVAPKVDRIAA